MWLPAVKILIIIALASQPPAVVHGARKHWKRAPVHGVFNVDVYAYNKPLSNLVGKQTIAEPGQALPMGQLLEQLSHISRRELTVAKSHYRNLDTDNYMASYPEVASANATADAEQIITQRKQSNEDLKLTETTATATSNSEPINSQLAEQQMNSSLKNSHAMRNLYSHEFHVQHMGKRKIVLLNTLSKNASQQQDRKPDSAEVIAQQTQPLNLKLAMPTLEENEKQEKQEQDHTTTPKMIENLSTAEMLVKPDSEHSQAISTLDEMESMSRESTTEQPNKSNANDGTAGIDDSKHGAKDANNMTTIEAANTANAYDKEQLMPKPELQVENEAETDADGDADATKKNDSRHDNDGQANGINAVLQLESMPRPVAAVDKPLTIPKSRRKQTKPKTKKRPNEIDTKPTTSSSSSSSSSGSRIRPSSGAMLMVGTANVKAPVKVSPEISTTTTSTHAPGTKKSKGKGKGKRRKGSQRRPSGSQQELEQEIETTTNWWQILPYAEIRKFLNTIYDSITEDDDDRRLGRHHHDNDHPAQRI
ncbi:uncharacterized protein DDB_G0284459 [Drosophila albomicans]|uniref:Uncharacterized protein DDB_G0284459 n=1 Tax=Drosophila albomicans TaxID=7291 RepID=A0A6P8WWX9_DROAB|nr:uncharacterized protein DDB_G0284459 [Drosophila albomicans]XP_051860853.1 uncharacterized protein DDB_G0284459 [Drosophila albomicans]